MVKGSNFFSPFHGNWNSDRVYSSLCVDVSNHSVTILPTNNQLIDYICCYFLYAMVRTLIEFTVNRMCASGGKCNEWVTKIRQITIFSVIFLPKKTQNFYLKKKKQNKTMDWHS